GNLCESGDVFTRDPQGHLLPRALDPTKFGDLVALCEAGAYGFSMASLYNARALPAEVLIDGDEARLIRERPPMDELLRGMA
ncbi:MAG: lysA, partial [Acidobacteria bacterium]|nr:lysA [Acidobacteriota bacterium]